MFWYCAKALGFAMLAFMRVCCRVQLAYTTLPPLSLERLGPRELANTESGSYRLSHEGNSNLDFRYRFDRRYLSAGSARPCAEQPRANQVVLPNFDPCRHLKFSACTVHGGRKKIPSSASSAPSRARYNPAYA